MTKLPNELSPTPAKPGGHYRWTICALIFFATTINYIDRHVISILKQTLMNEGIFGEAEYGFIVMAFQAAYAIGLVATGRLMDMLGTKLGYAAALIVWSFAAMGHALAKTAFGFGFWRFSLGLGEAGNFPAAIKTVAEWFPKKERALATGIFNAGTNVGAVVAPVLVPIIVVKWGWQKAFIFTGALGFIWLIFWFWLYEKPRQQKRLSAAELAYIESDPADPPEKISWLKLMSYRETWGFAIGKFLTDPIWWFYLYWIPGFLQKQYSLNLDVKELGLPLIIIYVLADVGSIGGGWLSSFFIKRGWTINKGRKMAMLICALAVTPIIIATQHVSLWVAVGLLGLATAAHQGWSANIFTTASDMFPRKVVGSVVGFGGMAGSVGGMIFSASAGFILEFTGSYYSLFFIAGSAYLIALAIFQSIVPNIAAKDMESMQA